jgi:hypothetical protein
MELRRHQRVRLKSTDLCPEEFGIVLENYPERGIVLIGIDKKYRDDEYDDGLRETPIEQIQEITVSICAWCDPDKRLTKIITANGYSVSHGICKEHSKTVKLI